MGKSDAKLGSADAAAEKRDPLPTPGSRPGSATAARPPHGSGAAEKQDGEKLKLPPLSSAQPKSAAPGAAAAAAAVGMSSFSKLVSARRKLVSDPLRANSVNMR